MCGSIEVGSDEVLTFPCFFSASPLALFFSANRKNYYQLNPHIFFENLEFAKINTRIFFENIEFANINTRKKQSKHHSQKFIPIRYWIIKKHINKQSRVIIKREFVIMK